MYTYKIINGLLVVVLLIFFGEAKAYNNGPEDSLVVNPIVVDSLAGDTISVKKGPRFQPSMGLRSNGIHSYFNRFGLKTEEDYKGGKLLEDIRFSGIFRFVSIYRNMSESYEDMQTSDKNISFLDYPLTDIASSGGVGNPILALAVTSKINKNAYFRISYSISHSFTGGVDNDFNKFFSSNGGILFEGGIRTNPVNAHLKFGGVMTLRVSRLIFDAPRYRNNLFDRLVSNQYNVGKMERMYSDAEADKSFLWPYVRGGVVNLTFPTINNIQFLGMYGRTGRTIFGPSSIDGFPAINYLARIRTPFRYRANRGAIAFNFLMKDADTDPVLGVKDNVTVLSTDLDLKFLKDFNLAAEIGMSKIENPLITDPSWGTAMIFNLKVDERLIKFPLEVEFYNIDHDFGNVDGEVLNSNVNLKDGGVTSTGETDQSMFVNVGQEVGLVANNRWGVSIMPRFNVGDLKVELGYAFSQEKQNLYDTIVFQHRVNGFSRSRFWQWRQGIGPYGHIRSVFARTFEQIEIRDDSLGISKNYKKGFNNIELGLKYGVDIFGKRWIFANYNNFVSIQDGFSIVPQFSDKAFIRTFYEDFTVMVKLNTKFMVLANCGYERVWGNTRLELSPDKVLDGGGQPLPAEERTIDQTGWAIGFGFGYDITSKISLHFRHKWMSHEDKNFTQDVFKGQESLIELKMSL